MTDRITKTRLQALCDTINETLDLPTEALREVDGAYRGNPGVHTLDYAYGGVALDRMAPDGGTGVSNVIGRGTMRETYDAMQSYLAGLRAMRAHLEPEYLVTLAVREENAQGVFEDKPFLVRVRKGATTRQRHAAYIKRARLDGFETRNVIKETAMGR